MLVLLLVLAAAGWLTLAYFTHGRWLARSVFGLARPGAGAATTPAHARADGRDFVATRRSVLFGHHFTSIAATGPIVGPAIAVIWGWGPALAWVLLGSVFFGAAHDFGSLAVSARSGGRTVGDLAGEAIGRRVRLLFLAVLALALTIVLAIFGLVIAAVFRGFPAAITPVLLQVPLALGIGLWLHRRGVSLGVPSAIALAAMFALVLLGDVGPLHALNAWFASWPTVLWVGVLLGYCYVASVLPVWVLLQPRDYINALQLVATLGLVVVGLAVAAVFGGAAVPGLAGEATEAARPALSLAAAPALRTDVPGAPPIVPFLFITIACGACSGFHCLVASGTSSKQLDCEADAQPVGYGAMVLEAFLAVVVIVACTAGLGLGVAAADGSTLLGADAWASRYPGWSEAGGLAAMVNAFVDGSANLLRALGIPAAVATALMGVFVASFAATTLDSATRLQRYVLLELAGAVRGGPLVGSAGGTRPVALHAATALAVGVAAALAALPAPGAAWSWATAGSGGLILWPLFGAVNQLMAGVALLVIAFWLRRRGAARLAQAAFGVPALAMLVLPGWAVGVQAFAGEAGGRPGWLFAENPNLPLLAIAALTAGGVGWIAAEAAFAWNAAGRRPAPAEEPPPRVSP